MQEGRRGPVPGGRSAVLGVLALLAAALPAWADELPPKAGVPWVTAEDYGRFRVVVGEGASDSERYAAGEFTKYWKECTGHDVPVADRSLPGTVTVRIGPAAGYGLRVPGDDGFVIRTLDRQQYPVAQGIFEKRPSPLPVRVRSLTITGDPGRGTLYGVYEFFERYLGVRWLAPGVTHVPAAPASLPEIDFRYAPPFYYRDVSYRAYVDHPEFAAVHRLNGFWSEVPPEMGGHIGYARGWPGFGHTFHYYVNPEEYFDEHPEYFSEIDGERIRDSQLCLTNPGVLEITIEKVLELLRNGPEHERIVSVTQMDAPGWASWCTCGACSALDRREGGPSGSLIHFVNRIAEAVEEEFPDAYIDTFAYMYTRTPPRRVKPRDNVIVRLCSIECDFGRPLADRGSPNNRAFRRDIRAWRKIAKNLFVWDYTQNWYSHQGPHPNFHVFQPNARFYARNGVAGLFEQASPFSPHSDYEFLKGYLLAHSLWDPEVDWHQLYDEFIDLYYGEGGPFVREYIDLITEKVRDDEVLLTFINRMKWMDYDTVVRAQEIFGGAFAAVRDETLRERLSYAYLPVQYAALVCPPRVERTEEAYLLTRPPSQTFDAYWAMLMDYGVTHLEDWPIEKFRDRLGGETPPRHEEMGIEKLENEAYEVWVLPALGGAVLRFRDKATGHELLDGYESILEAQGMWREWEVTEPGGPYGERPLQADYTVTGREAGTLEIRAGMDDGLVVERRMELAEGSEELVVTLELRNTGDATLTPRLKLVPEFRVSGKKAPRLWLDRGAGWERVPLERSRDRNGAYAQVSAEGVLRWAVGGRRRGVTVVNTFEHEELESLECFFSPEEGRVSLELTPKLAPLSPGDSRFVHARYQVFEGLPPVPEGLRRGGESTP